MTPQIALIVVQEARRTTDAAIRHEHLRPTKAKTDSTGRGGWIGKLFRSPQRAGANAG